MTPNPTSHDARLDLFHQRLENMISQSHELYRLADLIKWSRFEEAFDPLYSAEAGCPGRPIRLMVGLQYLKHLYGLSDEQVVAGWVENPYWQYFCGEQYFQHKAPVEPSSLNRFRKRIGTSGSELLLQESIAAGVESKAVKKQDFKRVTVDTTVQEKAITYPTDAKLLERARQRLVRLCKQHGVALRQTYARLGPRASRAAGMYARAQQYKRMRRQVKQLRTYLGRVLRDIRRRTEGSQDLQEVFAPEVALAERVHTQRREDKHKLYSLHAPEVECIGKGKAHKRYEFGVKVSIAVTNRSNFIVGGQSLAGNPYDGHTLSQALEQVRRLTGAPVEEAYVDRGYRGHQEQHSKVYISGQRRGVRTHRVKKCMKRRQAIEPVIGHLKQDGLLGRNFLLGSSGDEWNVLLCCAGQNLRLVLRRLEVFCARLREALRGVRRPEVAYPAV